MKGGSGGSGKKAVNGRNKTLLPDCFIGCVLKHNKRADTVALVGGCRITRFGVINGTKTT